MMCMSRRHKLVIGNNHVELPSEQTWKSMMLMRRIAMNLFVSLLVVFLSSAELPSLWRHAMCKIGEASENIMEEEATTGEEL